MSSASGGRKQVDAIAGPDARLEALPQADVLAVDQDDGSGQQSASRVQQLVQKGPARLPFPPGAAPPGSVRSSASISTDVVRTRRAQEPIELDLDRPGQATAPAPPGSAAAARRPGPSRARRSMRRASRRAAPGGGATIRSGAPRSRKRGGRVSSARPKPARLL